jgi:hypothetical protein
MGSWAYFKEAVLVLENQPLFKQPQHCRTQMWRSFRGFFTPCRALGVLEDAEKAPISENMHSLLMDFLFR